MARDAMLAHLNEVLGDALFHEGVAKSILDAADDCLRDAYVLLEGARILQRQLYQKSDQAWEALQYAYATYNNQLEQIDEDKELILQRSHDWLRAMRGEIRRNKGFGINKCYREYLKYRDRRRWLMVRRGHLAKRISRARNTHCRASTARESARIAYDQAKREYENAKRDHNEAYAHFKEAKARSHLARKAVEERRSELKAILGYLQDNKYQLALAAGIPEEYADADRVKIVRDATGVIHFYFGGDTAPDGPGHGHYVTDQDGTPLYRRNPFCDHGSGNFVTDFSYAGT